MESKLQIKASPLLLRDFSSDLSPTRDVVSEFLTKTEKKEEFEWGGWKFRQLGKTKFSIEFSLEIAKSSNILQQNTNFSQKPAL